jgi:hypothetical protein
MPKIRKFNEKEKNIILQQFREGVVLKEMARKNKASIFTLRTHLREWLGDEYDEIMKTRISHNANIRLTNMMQRRIFKMSQNKD